MVPGRLCVRKYMARIIDSSLPERKFLIVLRAVLAGGLIGLLIWALATIVGRWIFEEALCGDIEGVCEVSQRAAGNVAGVIGAAVGAIVLALLKIPLAIVVVLGTLVVTWGLVGWLTHIDWGASLTLLVAAHGALYGLFAYSVNSFSTRLGMLLSLGIAIGLRLLLSLT